MKRQSHRRLAARFVLNLLCAAALAVSLVSCVKQARRASSDGRQDAPHAHASALAGTQPVNINTASREELERLPGIGQALASRIIEHRERFGRFRRAEHLIMVRGLSDRRFRALRSLITV
jgi:competence ComEA-like helix-hairpin-helix protein